MYLALYNRYPKRNGEFPPFVTYLFEPKLFEIKNLVLLLFSYMEWEKRKKTSLLLVKKSLYHCALAHILLVHLRTSIYIYMS